MCDIVGRQFLTYLKQFSKNFKLSLQEQKTSRNMLSSKGFFLASRNMLSSKGAFLINIL